MGMGVCMDKRKVVCSIATKVKVAMESWKEFLPAGCTLCACLAGPKFGLRFLSVCLFVCVSALISSAIITSRILLKRHSARLYLVGLTDV